MTGGTNRHRPNALADRIAGLNDPSMGDERERDVILRAYTFGSVISTYVFFALGIFFAAIGAGYWSIPIILASGASGLAVSVYCKREGVDFTLATARAAPKRLVTSYSVSVILTIAWVFALMFHHSTGHPLIQVGLGSTFGGADVGSSMIIGAIVGSAMSIAILTLSRRRKLKQARLEAARAADIEDED